MLRFFISCFLVIFGCNFAIAANEHEFRVSKSTKMTPAQRELFTVDKVYRLRKMTNISSLLRNTLSPTLGGNFIAISLIGEHAVSVGFSRSEDSDKLAAVSFTSNDSGNSWAPSIMPPPPSGNGYPLSVACSSDGQQICIAVGSRFHQYSSANLSVY